MAAVVSHVEARGPWSGEPMMSARAAFGPVDETRVHSHEPSGALDRSSGRPRATELAIGGPADSSDFVSESAVRARAESRGGLRPAPTMEDDATERERDSAGLSAAPVPPPGVEIPTRSESAAAPPKAHGALAEEAASGSETGHEDEREDASEGDSEGEPSGEFDGHSSNVCPVCSKVFNNWHEMSGHLRAHRGQGTHTCEHCNKAFFSRARLAAHMRLHLGGRELKCPTCSKHYKRVDHLESHLRLHGSDRPFMCDGCGKRFVSRTGLLSHASAKQCSASSLPYVCNSCDKAFAFKSSLEFHRRVHSLSRRFACTVCGQRYGSARALALHVRNHPALGAPEPAVVAEAQPQQGPRPPLEQSAPKQRGEQASTMSAEELAWSLAERAGRIRAFWANDMVKFHHHVRLLAARRDALQRSSMSKGALPVPPLPAL